MEEESSNPDEMSDDERKQREKEYNFRYMYKKMLRRQRKNGAAPDPDSVMREMILNDS
jgi:hypothetical protein